MIRRRGEGNTPVEENAFGRRAHSNNAHLVRDGQYQQQQNLIHLLNLYSTGSRPISSQFSGQRRLKTNFNHESTLFNKYLQQPTCSQGTFGNRALSTAITTASAGQKSCTTFLRRRRRKSDQCPSSILRLIKGEGLDKLVTKNHPETDTLRAFDNEI